LFSEGRDENIELTKNEKEEKILVDKLIAEEESDPDADEIDDYLDKLEEEEDNNNS